MQKTVALLVITVLSFADLATLFHVPFLPESPKAMAATGDFSIFREDKGTETVDSSVRDVSWDISVSASGNIALQGNNSDIDLVDGGKYLVMYNVWTEQGTSTAGTNRRSHQSWLTLAGTPLEYGRGGSYLRDGSGATYAYNSGSAIVDATAGDDLQIHIQRDDANTTAGMNVRPSTNGVSVLKLKDGWDYLRVHKSSDSSDIEGNTSFTDVTWDTDDEVDTGSFGFAPTSGNITIKGDDNDHFLVTANVRLNRTDNNTRLNYEMILTLDGAEIPGTRVTSYLRGNSNGNDDFDDALVYTGLIKKDSIGDQTLNVEVRRESTSGGGSTIIVGDETALSIVALPDEGSYLMLGDDVGAAVASTRTDYSWTTQDEVDAYAFSHSTTTNASRIEIDRAGDYLFFSTMYATTTAGANDRQTFRSDWRKNGSTLLNYGSFGQFNRNNSSYSSGASGALIMDNLGVSDYVEVTQFDESGAPDTETFNANRVAVQGILLDENFFGTDVKVSATSSHATETSVPTTGFYSGGGFVIEEQTSSRNVTSITVTENGTIDGQAGLDNIELYYDLDTTAPYDCTGESYNPGSDSQFGSTDTTGFSGANGVSSFSDSETISTTQTMCVYVVYDVTESASDGETVIISIDDPSNDVGASGGPAIGPVTSVAPSGSTSISNAELTLIHYHWRNDDGSEAAATSVDGSEDTPAGGFQAGTPRRLRVEVSTEGSADAPEAQFQLQYGVKSGSCAAISDWINVADDGGEWDVGDSPNLTFASDSSNIASQSNGAVTDEESTFVGTSAILDTSGKSLDISLMSDEFTELEYTIEPTDSSTEGTTYCFRVVDGTPDVTHQYRLPITIQSSQIDSGLTDFPVFVDLSDLGNDFFSNVSNDGGDIRITESDGTTAVAREVVSINTGASTGELYFKAPSLSSTVDTTFYLYYGAYENIGDQQASSTDGAHGVWGSNYSAVYHLGESGATYYDSTANGYHGIGEATDPSVTTGKIGSGQDFGANGRIDLGTGPSVDLNAAGEYYVSTWLNLDTSTGDQAPVSQYDGAGDFMLWADEAGGGTGFCHYNGSYMPADCADLNNQSVGNWQYVAAYHDGTNGGLYLDGAESGSGPVATTFGVDTAMRFGIGATDGDAVDRYFDGQIDEVRISEVSFGLDWSKAEFINQSTSTQFYSTSSQQTMTQSAVPIVYDVYPEASINADIEVSATSSQVTTLNVGSTAQHIGGGFVIERNGTSRTVTDITITATGTVDAQANLDNIELWYDLDTTSPYDCTGEAYTGVGETQFGGTDTDGFSGPNGSSTFSGSQSITNTQSMCVYVLLDVGTGAAQGENLIINIEDPSSDVVVTASTVGPSSPTSPTGSTTISGPILTQTHYHWRNDDGDETDTGATSASGGVEDTAISGVPKESTRRLRLQVSNEGLVSSQATPYQLEYGTKVTSCSDVGSWTNVGDTGGAFDMSLSSNIGDGNTTDIDNVGNGAMTEENTIFVGTGALRETEATSSAIALTSTQYTELEFSVEATLDSGYETTYCFRVTDQGSELPTYTNYAELTTRQKQDFYTQTGRVTFTGDSHTLTAGTDYIAPASAGSAFVRITNSHHTGAGTDIDVDSTQSADDVTAYISNPENIETSFTVTRPAGASASTTVSWELVEFIGIASTDNEMIVREHGTVTYGTTDINATGTVVSGVVDDADVVVFITGQYNPDTGTNYYSGQSTAFWHATNSVPVFTRGSSGSDAGRISYAVVEYVGANWSVERVEHPYTAAGVAETEDIVPVPAINQAFIHTQKWLTSTESGLEEFGHEVWISSIGAVSFRLEDGANTATNHTSVAWVVSNTQTGAGKMQVYQSNGILGSASAACAGIEPCTENVSIGGTLSSVNNSSIFFNNFGDGSGSAFPRTIVAVRLISTTEYETWRSDTGQPQDFRAEVVEWPVAETSIRQNYYRFYVDNDSLDPTDPWPVGASDLGENTTLTGSDDPLGEGDRLRIRMTLLVNNATLPAETQSFKIQFGKRDTACSAIDTWTDLGDPASGAIWRGYDTTVADGTSLATSTPAPGTLNISVSDISGTFEEQNNTAINPFSVDLGQDVEYDWVIQHNGATQLSDYCFRMVKSDDTELDGYLNYPTIRTTGYTPVVGNWRWYDDATSTTPATPMANENSAPIDIASSNEVKLRLTAAEVEGAPGNNVKFALQYSEYSDFSDGGHYLISTTSCKANSLWCYADGAGIDNAVIDTSVISDADSCAAGVGDGCGTHNEAATTTSSHGQPSLSKMEFEFTLKSAGARTNAVYYFRLYDVTNDVAVSASSTYPSLVTEGSSLVFTSSGLPAGATTEGIVTDVATASTSISFGSLPFDTEYEAGYRLAVGTNATEGYQILMVSDQNMQNGYGTPVPAIAGTNALPVGWSVGCSGLPACFGYHVGDDSLSAGSARFAADDSYAALSSTTAEEVAYSSIPVDEYHDIVYKIQVDELQASGDYAMGVTFIAIPVH